MVTLLSQCYDTVHVLYVKPLYNFHLVRGHSLFPVVPEGHCIITVLKLVLSYPLLVSGRMPSLGRYTRHSVVITTQINLQPLMAIAHGCRPASRFNSILLKMESAVVGSMIKTVLWRHCNLSIRDCSAFHAQSVLTYWNFVASTQT